MLAALTKLIRKTPVLLPTEMGSVEAYDIWAQNYDAQPNNLMLLLDEQVFGSLLNDVDIAGKQVADIGCGTGRHWAKLLSNNPAQLTGLDVSQGMLNRLQNKFPQAKTQQITADTFARIPDATYDVIVSTLTVAHIENIDQALQTWSRILKPEGDIIITDFHPDALAIGGKRTFNHGNTQIAVRNFVHHVTDIENTLIHNNFGLINKDERIVNATVKHYYTSQNALPVYEKFKGQKIIYGIHLRRG